MAKKIIFEDKLPSKIRLVAGVDVAYTSKTSVATVVVLDYDSLELVEKQTTLTEIVFPYVPTLLSFREMKPAVTSIRKLKICPDLFLVDAHGFAHPYHCGFASHLGLVLNKPTIGVAKRKLVGQVKEGMSHPDSKLIEYRGEIIGAEVHTKTGCKPVYVSVGNMVTLKTSINIVKRCARNSRIPEPIRAAHHIATNEREKIISHQ